MKMIISLSHFSVSNRCNVNELECNNYQSLANHVDKTHDTVHAGHELQANHNRGGGRIRRFYCFRLLHVRSSFMVAEEEQVHGRKQHSA